MTNQTNGSTALDTEKSSVLQRVNVVVVVYLITAAILAVAIGLLFHFQGPARRLFGVGLIISILAAVELCVIVVVQNVSKNHQPPTGPEIAKDLLVALWGIGFAIPLIFVALDGNLTPPTDWIAPSGLAIVSVLIPAIRPRTVRKTTLPSESTPSCTVPEDGSQ